MGTASLIAYDHPVYREERLGAVNELPRPQLGLATCGERVEAVGGRLELVERPGELIDRSSRSRAVAA